MTTKEKISKNLKYQMEKNNISVKYLADCVGLSERSIRNFMSGKSAPRFAQLLTMCRVLGVSADYLLGVVDEFGNKILE